jgi:DNA (cytosine-5)-methyltransferase 1
MIGWTYCSGIGAPEAAAPFIDWRLASEIEDFPRAVLAHRFGHRPDPRAPHVLWSDFTALRPRHARRFGWASPEIIVAGTPCQAFSVAGARRSLADARGNLTMEFIRNVHAFAIVPGPRPLRWVVWENVPGVLSTDDNAFGCFLGGLVGDDAPLPQPPGGRWPGAGMVEGPRGRAAWRIHNAEHFGVAQRRRRVFVVFCPGERGDPAAVLFEPAGGDGHPAPCGREGQDVAPTLSARTRGGGGLGTDFDLDGGLIVEAGVVHPALTTRSGEAAGQDAACDGRLIVSACHPAISATVTSKWAKGSGGPAGDETQNLVAFHMRQDPDSGPVAPPLDTFANSVGVACVTGDRTHALTAEGHDASEDGTGRGAPLVGDGYAVRRITPVEAERLQGFPDGHTAIPWRGRVVDAATAEWLSRHCGPDIRIEPAPAGSGFITDAATDGRRFKALGNSQAVPNIAWILRRIGRAEGIL